MEVPKLKTWQCRCKTFNQGVICKNCKAYFREVEEEMRIIGN